mgnify:CR=1 FL=1
MRNSPLIFFMTILCLWLFFECCSVVYKKTVIENYEKEVEHGRAF